MGEHTEQILTEPGYERLDIEFYKKNRSFDQNCKATLKTDTIML